MAKTLTIIISIVLLFSCICNAQGKIAEQDESFDPMSLSDPPLPILDGSMIYEIITDIKERSQNSTAGADTFRIVEKMGWKIQILSTKDFFLADSIFKQSSELFENQEVRKIFNSPYYKIRVGNCISREDAEKILTESREYGYYESWIIKTRVKIKEKVFSY